MNQDPIVEEIRANRRKLAEKFDFDVKKIVADAELRQTSSGHRLVSFASQQKKVACP